MRVVHIAPAYGPSKAGGAAIASSRLHEALIKRGIDSHYVCIDAKELGTNIYRVIDSTRKGSRISRGGHLCGLRNSFISRLQGLIYLLFTGLTRRFALLAKLHRRVCLNIIPLWGLESLLNGLNPDVVHVQWINEDVISFSQLKAMAKWPVVLHLHDLFIVNVINPYPGDDERFISGLTARNSTLLERWLHRRKLDSIRTVKPMMEGPSNWICSLAAKSIIGSNLEYAVLQNLLDADFVCARDANNSHLTRPFRMLFGAFGGRRNPCKGWEDLRAAIGFLNQELRNNCEVYVFGEAGEEEVVDGVKVSFKGVVRDKKELCKLYNESDVFLLPSKQDNAPSTKFEALLCGLPVIAFQRTGCAEFLRHKENGWVASDGDIRAYADGISYYYTLWKSRMIPHDEIANGSGALFSPDAIVARQVELYSKVVKSKEKC